MLTRRFGRTDLAMPVLSCGGMRFQQSWTRDTPTTADNQRNLEATIDRALELGITHIETARGYGTSEEQLGPALARHARDRFILQTKVPPSDDPRAFETQLEESFRRLRVDYVDLFSFHGLNTADTFRQTLRDDGCMVVAERWQREGRIRHIGFSTHAPTPLIVDAIDSKRFAYVNLHYYYLFQDNLSALTAARHADMGVFIISPTDKGGRLQRPSEKLRALCQPLSPIAFNDIWCLAHPEIHTLSVGAATPSDFDEHVRAVDLLAQADTLLPPIVDRLRAAYRAAVGPDFADRWAEGLPEWHEIPNQINVRRILWLRNLLLAYDLGDFAQERYASMSPDDHWVPGARAAHVDDKKMMAALPLSPFRDRIPDLLRDAHRMLHNPNVRPMP